MAKRQHKINIFLSIGKIPCFCQKNSKNPEKLIVFQGFYSGQHFYPLNMVYVTGLELTILTNLLFIMIPQGYLPCAKLFTMLSCSCIMISSDCVFGDWQVFFYCTQSEFFCLPHRLSLFWTPRLSRGFRCTIKNSEINSEFFYCFLYLF